MIRETEKIPTSSIRQTQTSLIEADIKEAISRGLEFFEFVGDDYNYKYLPTYARDTANVMLRREQYKIRDAYLIAKGLTEVETRRMPIYFSQLDYKKYIRINSIKGEEHRRVFCTLNLKDFKKKVEIITEQGYIHTKECFEWNDKLKRWVRKIEK